MEKDESKRQTKRDSSKKSKDHSIFNQKSVRAREALCEKKCLVRPRPPGKK